MKSGIRFSVITAVLAVLVMSSVHVIAGGKSCDDTAGKQKHLAKKIADIEKQKSCMDRYEKDSGDDADMKNACTKKKETLDKLKELYTNQQQALKQGDTEKYQELEKTKENLYKENFNADHAMNMYRKANCILKDLKHYKCYFDKDYTKEIAEQLKTAAENLKAFYKEQASVFPELWKSISSEAVQKENQLKLVYERIKADLNFEKSLYHYKKKLEDYKDSEEVKQLIAEIRHKYEEAKTATIEKIDAQNRYDLINSEIRQLNDKLNEAICDYKKQQCQKNDKKCKK